MDEDLATLAGSSDAVVMHTGFPNPALDRFGQGRALALNLNQLLVNHPSSTYLFRISGHQWESEGIFEDDVAIVDRALRPHASDLAIVWQTENFSVCRGSAVREGEALFGVITAIIHQFR